MSIDQREAQCSIYLAGDPCPILSPLTVEQVASLICDYTTLDTDGSAFVRIPTDEGRDALVRPSAITAIMPECDSDDDDD